MVIEKLKKILEEAGISQPLSISQLVEKSGYDVRSVRRALAVMTSSGDVLVEEVRNCKNAPKKLYSMSRPPLPSKTCDYCNAELDGDFEWKTDQDINVQVCKQCNTMLAEHYGEDDFPPLEIFEFAK